MTRTPDTCPTRYGDSQRRALVHFVGGPLCGLDAWLPPLRGDELISHNQRQARHQTRGAAYRIACGGADFGDTLLVDAARPCRWQYKPPNRAIIRRTWARIQAGVLRTAASADSRRFAEQVPS